MMPTADNVSEAQIISECPLSRFKPCSPLGWDTVVVDYRWYDPALPPLRLNNAGALAGADADNGRRMAACCPRPIASRQRLNGQGFQASGRPNPRDGSAQFGIHIMRGIPRNWPSGPTCRWKAPRIHVR